ncbi:uncharacterized protein [Ptychodera flava]|uniref:uncharacterized protein n=1 Tax=Ptychodera flava TaxID=63121 RepID=UPI00396A2936
MDKAHARKIKMTGKKKRGLRSIISKFAKNTTAHGIANISNSTSTFGRTVWSVVCVTAFSLFLWQSSELLKDYLEYGIKIKFDVVSVPKLSFPTVTVCNTNKIRKSEILKSEHRRILVVDEDVVHPYYAPCLPSDFTCKNGTHCIKQYLVCDGINHCQDMSDEDNCDYGECGSDQFRCASGSPKGYCIDDRWRCDRKDDCYNQEDEMNCDCRDKEFQCDDSSGTCLTYDMVNDGIKDCPGGSDENSAWALQAFKSTYNKRLSPKDAVLKTNTSLGLCALSCMHFSEFTCLSFDYDSQRRECYINPGSKDTLVRFTLTNDDDYDYYERIYRVFSALESNTALKFERFPNAKISSNIPPKRATTEECAQLCLDEISFDCLAFTYEPFTSRCWLHNKSHLLDSIPLIKDSTCDYYYRRGMECYTLDDGTDYRGHVSLSSWGERCMNWSSLDPSKFKYTPSTAPGKGLGNHNYCRNPNDEPGTWCYVYRFNSNVPVAARCTVNPPKYGCLSQKQWEKEIVESDTFRDSKPIPAIAVNCSADPSGQGYRGNKSTTVSGKQCQNWLANSPHSAKRFSTIGIDDYNYCRNPNEAELPWCYTNDPNVTWEYCDVREQPCIDPDKECYTTENGTDYRGFVYVTISGNVCKSWIDVQSQNGLALNSSDGIGDHNYCRNPNNADAPWCYTTISGDSYESCNVGQSQEECSLHAKHTETKECFSDPKGTDYRGTISTTVSGHTCRKWKDVYLNTDNLLLDSIIASVDHNYCRNPNHERSPWCFTINNDKLWDFCDVGERNISCNFLGVECFYNQRATDYRGYMSTTSSGRKCQKWTEQSPHTHPFDTEFYHQRGIGNHNYCRNPTGEMITAWCFTTDRYTPVDFCDLELDREECVTDHVLDGFSSRSTLELTYDHQYDAMTEKQCATLCLDNIAFFCVGFYYSFRNETCYLRSTSSDQSQMSVLKGEVVQYTRILDDFERVILNLQFSLYPNMKMFDEVSLKDVPAASISECIIACVEEETFTCKSLDFNPSQSTCHLYEKPAANIGDLLKKDVYFIHLERRESTSKSSNKSGIKMSSSRLKNKVCAFYEIITM